MPITDQEIQTVKEIVLDGARTHFAPRFQFHDAIVAVRLDAQDEEFFDVHLLYNGPSRVLDGYLMLTFFRAIDEPLLNAGFMPRTLVHYSDINDPTLPEHWKLAIPPAPTS